MGQTNYRKKMDAGRPGGFTGMRQTETAKITAAVGAYTPATYIPLPGYVAVVQYPTGTENKGIATAPSASARGQVGVILYESNWTSVPTYLPMATSPTFSDPYNDAAYSQPVVGDDITVSINETIWVRTGVIAASEITNAAAQGLQADAKGRIVATAGVMPLTNWRIIRRMDGLPIGSAYTAGTLVEVDMLTLYN